MSASFGDSRQALEKYNLLCTIKPAFKEAKYPYNPWTPEKIDTTFHQLTLYRQGKSNIFTTETKNPVRGGGNQVFVFGIS